jgi:hypothetical protein
MLVNAPALAAEAPQSSADYRQLCTGKAAEANHGLCVGFVIGADQAFSLERRSGRLKPGFCIPAGTAPEQLTRVWMSFLNKHPELAREPAAASYFRAIAKTYPCPD